MAKKQAAEGQVKARVLIDSVFGKVNDVVVIEKSIADGNSDLDPTPDAVAYAESLGTE